MKENIVLIDFKPKEKWEFIEELNKENNEKWKAEKCVSNFKTNNIILKMYQYFLYFLFPFRIFITRKNYNKIIAWQQFYGLIFAFYCSLFKVKKVNKIVISTFIYKRKRGIIGKIYEKWIKYILNSVYIDKIICFARNEVEYYGSLFPSVKNKFEFVQLGVDIIDDKVESKKGDYFVSSGKSNRDYNFLIRSFEKNKEKLKVISYTSPESPSENIKVLKNVFKNDYYKEIANSFAVIISLDDPNISSGQLVLIHAMQLKKPIICTKSNAIADYIIDNKNGFIIDKTDDSLKEAIKKLKNKKIYDRLSEESYKMYINNFSLKSMAKNFKKIVNQ